MSTRSNTDQSSGSTRSQPSGAHCRQCGYNLHAIEKSNRCPECGLLVELSLRNDALHHANPEWLRRVYLGVTILIFAVAIGISHFWITRFFIMPFSKPFLQILSGVTLLSGLSGLWLLSTPEPGQAGATNRSSIRTFLRWIILLNAALYIGDRLVWIVASSSQLQSTITLASGLIIRVCKAYCFLTILALLAKRLPMPKFVRFISITRNVYLGILFIAESAYFISWVAIAVNSLPQSAGIVRFSVRTYLPGSMLRTVLEFIILIALIKLAMSLRAALAKAKLLWHQEAKEAQQAING